MSMSATCAVPGDVARVRQLADELRTMAVGLREAVPLASAASVVGWHGSAAAAFERLTDVDPEPFVRAAAALSAASDAVLAHAAVLAAAQRLAAEAAATMAAAPPGEEGRPLLDRAEGLLATARARLRSSGGETALALRQAAAAAPEEPAFVVRQLTALRAGGLELATGVAQGAGQLAVLVERFSPQRLTRDPLGYPADVMAAARAALDTARHPGRAWDAAVAAVQEHPTRAVGTALPALALGGLAGGSGAAALRGASLPARVTLRRTPGLPPAHAHAVVRSVRAGHRSSIRRPDLQPYLGPAHAAGGPQARLSALDHAIARVVLRDAAAAEPKITPRVRRVAGRLGSGLLQPEHAVKGSDSLRAKFAMDLGKVPGGPAVVSRRIGDSVRYAIAVPDEVYVARTLDAVRAMRAEGFQLAAAKARWSGRGYRGTNLTFLDPRTGRLFELQVHTPASWSANVATHADYEIARDPTRGGAERSAASLRIQGLYDGVPSPPGATELQARLRWPGPDVDQYSVRPPLRTLPEVHGGALAGGAAGGASGTAVEHHRSVRSK